MRQHKAKRKQVLLWGNSTATSAKQIQQFTLGLNAMTFKTISTVNTPVKTMFRMSMASLNILDCS